MSLKCLLTVVHLLYVELAVSISVGGLLCMFHFTGCFHLKVEALEVSAVQLTNNVHSSKLKLEYILEVSFNCSVIDCNVYCN